VRPGSPRWAWGCSRRGPAAAIVLVTAATLAALVRDGQLAVRRTANWPSGGALAAVLAIAVVVPAGAYRLPGAIAAARASQPPELAPDLVAALRRLPRRSVLLSDRVTAYEATAFADVLVYMVPIRNVADTRADNVRHRYYLNATMLDPRTPEAQRRALLHANGIGYVLARRDDRTGAGRYFAAAPGYAPVFADAGYVLVRVPA